MRGQRQHPTLVEAARRFRQPRTETPTPTKVQPTHPLWPEEELKFYEYQAKKYGHVQVDFRLRSFDERPAIHIEWRTNCTKCGYGVLGHNLSHPCPDPAWETKLVYHYQPDEEREAILMSRFDILQTLKDWTSEWAER